VKDLGNELPQLRLGVFQGGRTFGGWPILFLLLAGHDLGVHGQVAGLFDSSWWSIG
jgi:hypothetical protein